MVDHESWQDLPLPTEHAAPGGASLRIWRKLRSPQLQNYRDLIVALPPSYHEGTRSFPVVYMQDGQNLFDPATSYAGDWGLLDTLRHAGGAGNEAIVVGIANTGRFRQFEYSPWRDPAHGGGDGDRYLDFVVDTVRPLVEAHFRVKPTATHTAIAGSSLGGLISLYALYRHPSVFGAAAALSPSAWFADGALITHAEGEGLPPGRVYLDVGTAESPVLVAGVRRLDTVFRQADPAPSRYHYVEDEGAEHHEAHWARRFRAAWRFLVGEDGTI